MKYIENAVRGNFTNQQGFLKENGNDAIRNAHNYMVKELNQYEADFLEKEGREPTDKERADFMEMMGDIVIKYYSTDYGADPTMKSMTDYETEIKEAEQAKEIKDKEYLEAGVTELQTSIGDLLVDKKLDLQKIKEGVENDFNPSFMGIPFTGGDSSWFKFDSTDKKNFIKKNLPTAISKIFTDNNITLTPQMFEVMTEEDFISLKENIASAIGATTEQVDQAIQLAMKAQGN